VSLGSASIGRVGILCPGHRSGIFKPWTAADCPTSSFKSGPTSSRSRATRLAERKHAHRSGRRVCLHL